MVKFKSSPANIKSTVKIMYNLDEIRKKIDETDKQIITLLEKRIGYSKDVAAHKKDVGKKVFDAERERQKLEGLAETVENPENLADIQKIFSQIMLDSRKIQYRELEKNAVSMLDPYETIDEIPKKDVSVVYQGVPGAYAYIAMKRFFGDEIKECSVKTWREALEMIIKGESDFAVLPLENSTAGSVTQVYDLLSEYPVYIVAEEFVEIDHALLALPEADIENIKTVYSHSQALFQCADFLEEHKDWEKISAPNTAASAKKVSEDGDKTHAAIASVEAGNIYGLKILKERINDLAGNTTRFVIVSKQRRFLKNAGKVSVIFETPNEKGTLYNLLSQIVYNDLNMMKIESRPLRSKKWDSRFFAEFEGNLSDPAVRFALRGMYEEAKSMRLLGNY